MAQHIEDDAAAFIFAVIPRWPLRGLQIALKHPIAEFTTDREYAAKEASLDQVFQFADTRQEQLVLNHAVLDASRLGLLIDAIGIHQTIGGGFLAIDILACLDRLGQQTGAGSGGGGIKE